MDRRPPLLIAFPGVAPLPADAVAVAEETAGKWLLDQNPHVVSQSTVLTFGDGQWCYVLTFVWTVRPEAVRP